MFKKKNKNVVCIIVSRQFKTSISIILQNVYHIFTEQLQLSIVKGNKQPSVRLQLLRIMHISMAKIDLLALRFPIEISVGICVEKTIVNVHVINVGDC